MRQLRRPVWWAGMEQDVKQYLESFLGCVTAVGTKTVPPMTERQTTVGVCTDCLVDLKGPIGGKYYLHMIQNNLSRLPEVDVVVVI